MSSPYYWLPSLVKLIVVVDQLEYNLYNVYNSIITYSIYIYEDPIFRLEVRINIGT